MKILLILFLSAPGWASDSGLMVIPESTDDSAAPKSAASAETADPAYIQTLKYWFKDANSGTMTITPTSDERARRELAGVVEASPNLAMAHAALGISLVVDCPERSLGARGQANCRRGMQELSKALSLDPGLALPYYVRANEKYMTAASWGKLSGRDVEMDCDHAVRLAPDWDNELARICYNVYLNIPNCTKYTQLNWPKDRKRLSPQDVLLRYLEESANRQKSGHRSGKSNH